ncbi:squalene/phytoene synthase family protein [Nocardia brevicatena]|uniref:squalene/phytoene synthase family protein n=1 Tax=Nocardia brevicatena TaxID=37327 RepID=UPI0012FBB9DF|nr:squalene/phytoene synthase family protein [Nocardia brevicatena]
MAASLMGVLVRSWQHCLDAAGVRDRAARTDYSAAARYLCRRDFAVWGSVWVLSPPESRPHLVAAVALLRYTDDLSDRGPVEGRTQRFEEWAAHVATGLDTGSSGHRLLRPYLHSAALSNPSRTWIDAYLAGTRIDLDFPGFAEEADYQRYIDTVALPAVMLLSEAMPGLVPGQNFISLARSLVDGGQRADFLTDMFDDLRDGRLCLPVSDLDRYGVSRADLEQGRDTPGVKALISATASSARGSLVAGERILGEIAPEYRAFFRFAIGVFHQRLDDVGTRGAAIFRHPYHDAVVRSVALVARCRRMGASTKARSGHPEPDGPALQPS